MNNLPFPQIDPCQKYFQMAKKNGYYSNYPTAPHPMPMPRNNQNVTDNNQAWAVVVRTPEENNSRDILTIKQHQQRVNHEISDLEARRGVITWQVHYSVQQHNVIYSTNNCTVQWEKSLFIF